MRVCTLGSIHIQNEQVIEKKIATISVICIFLRKENFKNAGDPGYRVPVLQLLRSFLCSCDAAFYQLLMRSCSCCRCFADVIEQKN